jgi:serine/threonine protein phosphatase 1
MKLFVASDVHSYFTPLKKALDTAGFNPNNKEHWLILCGDCFDRGDESEELLHYIMTLERKVIVKGNHDILLQECCWRGFPYSHDSHNGTVRTIQDIGEMGKGYPFDECCVRTLHKLAAYRDLLVNYFETKNYIFVHSWIPMNVKYDEGASKPWHQVGKHYEYLEDWRNANDAQWEEAMWGNPFERHFDGLNKTGKTIVFGHWHCSAGHRMKGSCKSDFESDTIWEPFYDTGVIGIDRCTAHTGEVNVLALEDDFLDK